MFQGRIVFVGDAPNAWSSMLAIYQPVTWRIDRVLRGDPALVGTERSVRHPLVMGSRTARRDRPGLDATMFAPGAEWIVLATTRGEATCISENDGVLAATPELAAAIAAAR